VPRLARTERRLNEPPTLTERLRTRLGFTKTEVEVAVALVKGLSYGEIAKKLGTSYHTVHTHIKAVHQKAGVATTGQLTALIRGALDVKR
jgi:DNA-binding CsgD family transcriptional regulator